MLENIKPEKILFLDIETVPATENFDSLPENFREFWEKKSSHFRKENDTAADVYARAGIYAEFGRIICISFGIIHLKNGERNLRLKSIFGHDEKKILIEFAELLNKLNANNDLQLCAHNGKEFDYPYISRRMLIHSIKLPAILDIAGKKPWETQFLDTMELWKFGDYKNYTSLNVLAALFNIPSPKDDIDGSKVAEVYYKEKNLNRIVKYCEKDTITVAQIFLKYKQENIIVENNIESVTEFV